MNLEEAAEHAEAFVRTTHGNEAAPVALAAVGLVMKAWRNTEVEEAHAGNGLDRIHDGEMFAANAAATRLALEHLRADPVDWTGLADAFTGPARVAGRRTVADLLGPLYGEWAESSHALIETQGEFAAEIGTDRVMWLNAMSADPLWWGAPKWPSVVAAFLDEVASALTGTSADSRTRRPGRASSPPRTARSPRARHGGRPLSRCARRPRAL